MTAAATLAELRALNAKFIHNFVTNDVASHDAILHAKFRCILPNGFHVMRAPYLQAWAKGFDPDVITYWDYRDERIELVGDTAFVGSTNRWVRVRDGVESIGMTTYTDTYVREGGKWLCALAQLTGVTPDNFPPDTTIVRKYIRGKLAA
jgi:hypothetical protein